MFDSGLGFISTLFVHVSWFYAVSETQRTSLNLLEPFNSDHFFFCIFWIGQSLVFSLLIIMKQSNFIYRLQSCKLYDTLQFFLIWCWFHRCNPPKLIWSYLQSLSSQLTGSWEKIKNKKSSKVLDEINKRRVRKDQKPI